MKALLEIDLETSDEEIVENSGWGQSGSTLPYPVIALCLFLLSWQASYKFQDTSVAALLAFLSHFLSFISVFVCSEKLSAMVQNFPRNITHLRKIAGDDVDSFTKFAVCAQCDSIYDFDNYLLITGSEKEVKLCQHITYPDHPHMRLHKLCAQPLLRTCRSNITTVYRPFKVFCCQSIISSLRGLLCRSNMLEYCEQCRFRNMRNDLFGDV